MARFYRFTYNNVLFPTGYNTLANTAFLETRRLNDINDISEIFYNQMIRLGIGINPNKDIKMNSNEYLSLLQYSFIDLYERGYIKYDYCDCYYDDLNNKIFDRINKPSLLPQSNIKSFYLDISNVVDNIVEKINSLNVLDETKSEMIDFLNPKSYLSINLSVSSGEELNIKMSNPELLGGISYILINPEHFDITNYIDPNEELSIISFLNDDNSNDVVFTGTFAKNPLTGADIPVFISLLFDKPYHLGIPDVDTTDREFAISNDLDIVRIIEDGKLIESDFISGYSQEEARSLIIDAFIDADIAIKEEVYEHTKILISSLDNYGALFPFLEDNNEIHSLKDYL
jgi:leucyl-tRNA synthetase